MASSSNGTWANPADKYGNWCATLNVDYDDVTTADGTANVWMHVSVYSTANLGRVGVPDAATVSLQAWRTGTDGERIDLYDATTDVGVYVVAHRTAEVTSAFFGIKKLPYDQKISVQIVLAKQRGSYGGAGSSMAYVTVTVPMADDKSWTPPTVEIHPIGALDRLPLTVEWDVTDEDGDPVSSRFYVMDGGNNVLHEQTSKPYATSATVNPGDVAFIDGGRYRFAASVSSTTGLTGTGIAYVTASFTPPPVPSVSCAPSDEDGATTCTVRAGSGGETAGINLYRDGELLASGMQDGDAYTDSIPPLDVAASYKAVAFGSAGGSSESEQVLHTARSNGFVFFNRGASVAKMRMNMAPKESHRPERELFNVCGRAMPVAMFGEHVERSGTVNADTFWLEDLDGAGQAATLDAWRAMAATPEPMTMRLPMGEVRTVAADVSIERGRTHGVAGISVEWTEVAR